MQSIWHLYENNKKSMASNCYLFRKKDKELMI